MGTAEITAGTNRRILIAILLAFVVLALVYSFSVPLGEAPDEVPHFNFIRFLADKHGLPEGNEAGSEGFQPPLYYAIGALATSWIDTSGFEAQANPDFSWDRPETSNNLLLHTKAESFPYHGGALAWHIARLLSIAMGIVTILATYSIGREIFPDKPVIALGMAAVNAFIPEFVFMSSVVSNDNLIAMLSSLLMLKLVKMLKGATAWRDFVQLGSLLGLSLITKSSAIALIPLVLMVLFSIPSKKGLNLLQSSLWCAITAVFAFGLSGWWFLRNQLVFGDLLGWSLKLGMSDLRQAPLGPKDFVWLADGLFQSFWGRFGGAAHLRLSFSLYVALSILVIASFAGCLIGIVKLLKNREKIAGHAALPLVIVALEIALIFVALVRWTMTFLGTDQARLIYPALSAIILFFVLGLLQLIPGRFHNTSLASLSCALFALAIITPFEFINPAYKAPDRLAVADLPSIPHQSSYDFDGMARLVGYEFDDDLYNPGETAQLILYWQTLGQIREEQWLQIQLLDKSGRVVFQKEGCPSGGSYSADRWQVGEVIPATHYLRLNASTPPGVYTLRLAMRPASSKAWVPVFDRYSGRVSDNITIAKVRLGSRSKSAPGSMENTIKATLGGRFSLLGYTLDDGGGLKPGGKLLLRLYWQKLPIVDVNTDYTVFTQLLSPDNSIAAQVDSQPVKGAYPTTIWEDKETIVDDYELTPSQVSPGSYSLIVGMYDSATGKRLSIIDANGRPLGDFVKLAELSAK